MNFRTIFPKVDTMSERSCIMTETIRLSVYKSSNCKRFHSLYVPVSCHADVISVALDCGVRNCNTWIRICPLTSTENVSSSLCGHWYNTDA